LIQAIYFDIGGVLVRTEDKIPRTRLAARLGMSFNELEKIVFGGEITAEEQWAYVCQQVNWPFARWRDLEAEFFAGDKLDEELVDYIRSLHRHYKTGVISNALGDVRTVILNEWHMSDAFDVLVISAEVGVMKPDARIFQSALNALGVQPAEAVFVDDVARNVEGARAIGMHAIQFRNTAQVRTELGELLHHI
jgi:epoxide hydrolase-like predicted phosphatase